FKSNTRLPDDIDTGLDRENVCANMEALPDYIENHPLEGMPFGTTNLTDEEYALFVNWLEQGGEVTPREKKFTEEEKQAVKDWEAWLNGSSNEQKLVSRWLYEHLYLARLYFSDLDGNDTYFEVVRSRTPSGEPIDMVSTRRPNDDPE